MPTDETVPYGIEIERLPDAEVPNYEIRRRDTHDVLLACGWISLETGQPFAFGGNTDYDGTENPAAEFGGRVRVEGRGDGDGELYPGARLHFLD